MISRVRLLVAVCALFLAGGGESVARRQAKELTVERIFSGAFTARGVRGFQWMDGGKAYSTLETDTARKQTDIWRTEAASGKRTVLVDASRLVLKEGDAAFRIQNYIWSPAGDRIIFTGTLPARALKSGGNFFLYTLKSGEFRQLTNTDKEQVNVKFSPDGSMIGFVRANDLYVLDLGSGAETRLTSDGGEHVFNGKFDWVYEEEFSIIDGWQWSPDGRRIAYWQIDESRVPDFPIVNFMPVHGEVVRQRYPKAGDPPSVVRIGVADRESGTTTWMDVGAPADSAQDLYVPRMQWTRDPAVLAIQRLNRRQDTLQLTFADAATGKARIVLTETDPAWVDVESGHLRFLESRKDFLWSSNRDGSRRLYLYDMEGGLVRPLTQGDWDVDQLLAVDERRGEVYFTASTLSPAEREVCAVGLDGRGFRRVTEGRGSNSANVSPDCSMFLHTFSDWSAPPRVSLCNRDGSTVRVVAEGRVDALKEYSLSPKTFFTFRTSDSLELHGWMIKPPDFDPARRYPVLMTVYGGPGVQTVLNSWGGSGFLWNQLLAQKGYIVASVDNRGTPARGRDFARSVFRRLDLPETRDQVEAARYLGSLPFVDSSRIGITGGSFGGTMALMCMLAGEGVFKAGIAVSPVTDWKLYDNIYTERYMRTPKDNPEGYKECAALNHADGLKGSLLIVHGTDDDNVHMQNSMLMINELINQKKQFTTALYPGAKHGVAGRAAVQYYTMLLNFILEKL